MSTGLLLLPFLLPLSTGVACKSVDPAPADLDGLLHWFWQKGGDGQDEELQDGVDNAFAIVDLDALADGPQDGSLSRLTDAETDLVGITGQPAEEAVGLYMVNLVDCDLDTLEPILWDQRQDQLYPGIYDDYQRTYTSSLDDYADRLSPTLTWDFWYVGSYLGTSYEASPVGGIRHVPGNDDDSDPVVLARTWMPDPAVFDGGNKSYEQDYQVEVYADAGGGQLLHLYGIWREADYGTGFTSENEGVQRLLLNALADWDERTEELCRDGLP